MPGVMQRKGKLPGRTLRVSFKSAFLFQRKLPNPIFLIFPSVWISPLQERARSDERMGDLKKKKVKNLRLPERKCKDGGCSCVSPRCNHRKV